MAYGKRHWYAETYPASGVGASAQSYSTPVTSTGCGPLEELDESTGAVIVPPDANGDGVAKPLADAIVALVKDRPRREHSAANAERTRHERCRAGTGKASLRRGRKSFRQTPPMCEHGSECRRSAGQPAVVYRVCWRM